MAEFGLKLARNGLDYLEMGLNFFFERCWVSLNFFVFLIFLYLPVFLEDI